MKDDILIKPLLQWLIWLTLGIGASVLICAVFAFGVIWANRKIYDTPPSPLAPARRLPPEPRLEQSPPEVLRKLRANEHQILNSYGWIDRERGIVRIPIEQAIERVAQENR